MEDLKAKGNLKDVYLTRMHSTPKSNTPILHLKKLAPRAKSICPKII